MERSKGIILIVVGLAAVLIVWKVAFKPTPPVKTPADANQPAAPTVTGNEIANASRQPNQQPGQQPNQQPDGTMTDPGQNPRSRGRGGNNNNNMGMFGSRNQDLPATNLRIVFPENLTEEEARALYNDYTQLNPRMGGRSRGGFGGGGGGFGGGGFGGGGFGGMGG